MNRSRALFEEGGGVLRMEQFRSTRAACKTNFAYQKNKPRR